MSDVNAVPDNAEVRAHLEQLLASEPFLSAGRSSAFLRYIVEARLSGEVERIQEYGIGLEVFERGDSFDPRIDSIVHVEARRLRQRLTAYYESQGADDPLRIVLTNRGYVPQFTRPDRTKRRAKLRNDRLPTLWVAAGATVLGVALAAILGWAPRVPETPTPTAFVIPPPPGSAWTASYRGGAAAVSPNGLNLALVGQNASGVRQLYLRPVDSPEAEPIPETDGARSPFWSPDGRQIGFTVDTTVRILDRDSGIVRTIVDAGDVDRSRGGSWSSHDGGTILFALGRGAPIHAVHADGGENVPVTDVADDESGHESPRAVADGRHFVFAAAGRDPGQPSRIYLGDLKGGPARILVEAESHAIPVRTSTGDDYLLYIRDGVLLADRLDIEAGRLDQSPVPIAKRIESAGSRMTSANFSAGGGVLMYTQRSGYFGLSELRWVDRRGKTIGTVGPTDLYYYVGLSSDDRFAVVSKRETTTRNTDIHTMDVSTGISTRRTQHARLDRTPVWSPDGTMIAESSDRTGNGRIMLLQAGGERAERELLNYGPGAKDGDMAHDWTSEGLIYSRMDGARGMDVYLQPLDDANPTGPPKLLAGGPGVQANAKLSPDQRHLAYESDISGQREIYIVSYPDLNGSTRVSSEGGTRPLWRGDGKELYFISPTGAVMVVEIDSAKRLTFDAPKVLFEWNFPQVPAGAVYQYAVTQDGSRFLCITALEPAMPIVKVGWESALIRR